MSNKNVLFFYVCTVFPFGCKRLQMLLQSENINVNAWKNIKYCIKNKEIFLFANFIFIFDTTIGVFSCIDISRSKHLQPYATKQKERQCKLRNYIMPIIQHPLKMLLGAGITRSTSAPCVSSSRRSASFTGQTLISCGNGKKGRERRGEEGETHAGGKCPTFLHSLRTTDNDTSTLIVASR